MPDPTADQPVLDHIAVAVERHEDVYPRYVGELGGRWLSGGLAYGFAPSQLQYANGMKVELLQPHAVERNDFLRRFLDRRGPGAHHLTFKVADIHATMADAEDAGVRPVSVDLSDPDWQEAFLHPKDACGIVVQIAQARGEWRSPRRPRLPAPAPPQPADLTEIVHAVPSLGAGLHVFERILRGRRTATNADGEAPWVELSWTGPGRIKLVELPDLVGHEPGLLHHVAFRVEDPESVSDARPDADGGFEIAPADNFGVRLRLTAR